MLVTAVGEPKASTLGAVLGYGSADTNQILIAASSRGREYHTSQARKPDDTQHPIAILSTAV